MGIALSSHRLDVLERVFAATKDASLLEWTLQIVVREGVIGGSGRVYRDEVSQNYQPVDLFATDVHTLKNNRFSYF